MIRFELNLDHAIIKDGINWALAKKRVSKTGNNIGEIVETAYEWFPTLDQAWLFCVNRFPLLAETNKEIPLIIKALWKLREPFTTFEKEYGTYQKNLSLTIKNVKPIRRTGPTGTKGGSADSQKSKGTR